MIGGYEQVRSGEGFGALAFTPDGRLFGLTEINAGANQGPLQPNSIYHLNLETGLPTWLGQRSDLSFLRGGVFVPEPGSALCLAMAMVSLLACRSRRTYAPSASSRITG